MVLTAITAALSEAAWHRPLYPEQADQGDPFLLVSPEPHKSRYRFYVYTTAGGSHIPGKAFMLYASHDLLDWQPLEPPLHTTRPGECWAPAVVHIPELARPYVMLYSQGAGTGELAHRNQRLFRADARYPEGPFLETGSSLTPEIDFIIDPDLYELPDGSWRLICATDFDSAEDFTSGKTVGTGLAMAHMTRDLTAFTECFQELMRASASWQIYLPERKDQHWKSWFTEGQPVCWHCLEGAASIDADTILYSGGNYCAFYAMGILRRHPRDKWKDESTDISNTLLRPDPSQRFFGPGHGMVFVHPDDGHQYLIYHARYGSMDSPRQFAIAPLLRNSAGKLYCPPPEI